MAVAPKRGKFAVMKKTIACGTSAPKCREAPPPVARDKRSPAVYTESPHGSGGRREAADRHPRTNRHTPCRRPSTAGAAIFARTVREETFVSIVRVGLAETKNFAEGYDAIFGGAKKKAAAKKAKPSAKKTTKKKAKKK
jgi:hypothetical protein